MAAECEVDDCGRKRHGAEAYCESHRWRLRNRGDVLAHIPIGQLRALPRPAKPEPLTELEIAMAPAPAAGFGLLWLV